MNFVISFAEKQLALKPRPATSAPSETVTRKHRGRPPKKKTSDLPKSLSRTSFLCSTPPSSASSSVTTEVKSSALGSSLPESSSPVISLVLPQGNASSSGQQAANNPSSSSASEATFKVPAAVSPWASVEKYSLGNCNQMITYAVNYEEILN